jgi:hypothetical protein
VAMVASVMAVVQVHVDVDVLTRSSAPVTSSAEAVSVGAEVLGALVAVVPVVAESTSAASAPGQRLRLIPAEFARDRLEASQRRREVLGRHGAGDALAERIDLRLESVARLAAGIGERGREARNPAALRQSMERVRLGTKTVGETFVVGAVGEEIEHSPVATADAVSVEQRIHLF